MGKPGCNSRGGASESVARASCGTSWNVQDERPRQRSGVVARD